VASRELTYKVTGDVRDFKRAFGTVDKQLDTSGKRAHRFGSTLASTFKSVGGAAGVAGAAIAGGIVLETKRAVEAFQESNKVAKQTQAVLKSTGGVANVTAREVSNLATAISRKTGVDDEAVASAENLLLTFTNVRNEAGKGNKVFNQTTKAAVDMGAALGIDATKAAMQLGKALNDPEKGVTKLMRSGVTFTDQQKEQIKTLQESGRTLDAQKIILREVTKEFGGSAAAQATSTDKLKVAFGNLEEDLGSGLAPAVDQIAGKLTKFAIDVEPKVIKAADRIAKTFGRKDLSLDQKFRLSYDQARQTFKPLVDEARASIGKMHLGDRLAELIEKETPRMAEAFANAAPKAASRFVHAFADSNLWGQLVIGGLLLKKMGGLGAFAALGRKAGGAMAGGVATGSAAGGAAGGAATGAAAGAAGGLASKIPGSLKVAGGAAGGIAALKIGTDFLRGYAKADAAVKVFGDRVHKLVAGGDRDGLRRLAGEIRHYADVNQGSFNDSGKAARRYADDVEHAMDRTRDRLRASGRTLDSVTSDIRSNWRLMSKSADTNLSDIRQAVKTNMGVIKLRLGNDTEDGRKAVAKNFRLAAAVIKDKMEEGKVSTRTGTRQIRSYLIKGLEALGLSRDQAQAKLENGTLQLNSERTPGGGGGRRAGGGWIGQRGQRGGDNIPIVVGAGEAVLNRHQQAVVEGLLGNGFLDTLFSTVQTPHYMAKGGIVPVPGFPGESASSRVIPAIENIAHRFGLILTDAYGQGHKSPGHTKYGTAADFAGPDKRMDAAVKFLVGKGYLVGYDGRFGSQSWPGHGPSYVAGSNAHLHVELGGKGGGIAVATPKIGAPRVRGAGAVAAMADRGLQVATSAGNQVLRSVANSMTAMPVGGGGSGRTWSKGQLRSLWVRAGGDPKRANLMSAIALAESGGRSGIVNSIGATGLWQIHPGGSQYKNPLTNAKTAVMKLRTQGLGAWEAYTNGSYRQYMARGGFVGAAKGLSPKQAAARARAQSQKARGRQMKRAKANAPLTPSQKRKINRRTRSGLVDFYDQSIQAAIAQAGLTEDPADDIAATQSLVDWRTIQYNNAVASGNPGRIAEAASNLGDARSSFQQLTAPDGGDPNQALIDSNNALAEAIQNLATQNADLGEGAERRDGV
jgi:acid phosphatase family membrane protein YuiD